MGEPSSDRDAAEKMIYSRHIKEPDPKKSDAVKLGIDSEKSVEADKNNDGKTNFRKRKVNYGKTDVTLPNSKVKKSDAGKRDVHLYLTDANNTVSGTPLAQAGQETSPRISLGGQVARTVSQVQAQPQTTTVTTKLTPVKLAQRSSVATTLASRGEPYSDSYDTYYHHTDSDSAKKIIKSGYIKQSNPKHGDAVYGPGTYLTKEVGPGSKPSQVARNNYDGTTDYWKSKVDDGKTDVVFEVKVPKSQVKDCDAGKRDVHLYKGDLKLADAKNVRVHVRVKDGTKTYNAK